MELEPSSIDFVPTRDARPHMPELPPVWIDAVEHVHMLALAGRERELDEFYVGLIRLERITDVSASPQAQRLIAGLAGPGIVYRGENAFIVFEVIEISPVRPDYRPLSLQIPHFSDFIEALNDREIEFERQRGITAGIDRVLLQDPSANWVSVAQRRSVR